MALLVDRLIESARELLHGVDENLLALSVHLEALREGLGLPLNHSFPA